MAQAGPYDDRLSELRQQVAQNPVNSEVRLNLAYFLMLSEQPQEALTHYRLVLAQDSLSQAAAAGILWSLNSSQDWLQSLQEAARLVKLFPEYAPLHSYRGYAQSQKGLHHRARSSYKKAVLLSEDSTVKGYAYQGLAWSHHFLGDYPSARAAYKKATALGFPDSTSQKALSRLKLGLSLGSSCDLDSTLGYSARLQLSLYRLSFSAQAEEIRLGSEPYRQAYQFALGYKLRPLELKLRYAYLEGEEKRVYPAKSYGLSLSSSIYAGAFRIRPSITQDLGNYPRFNSYQSSAGLLLSTDALSLGTWISYLYLDNESAGSDRKEWITQLSAHYQLLRNLNLGAYYSSGDQSWWNSPGGVLNDSFFTVERSLAVSAKLDISRIMALTIYYQKGWMDEEDRDLLSLTLSAAL